MSSFADAFYITSAVVSAVSIACLLIFGIADNHSSYTIEDEEGEE